MRTGPTASSGRTSACEISASRKEVFHALCVVGKGRIHQIAPGAHLLSKPTSRAGRAGSLTPSRKRRTTLSGTLRGVRGDQESQSGSKTGHGKPTERPPAGPHGGALAPDG